MVMYVGGLFTIAGVTLEDIKEKKISTWKIIGSGILACLFCFISDSMSIYDIFWGILPGIWLLLLAKITKEKIGYGDGMAIISLGMWTGILFTLLVVCTGAMLAGIYGLICLLIGKKDTIPFMPFILLGMEVVLLYVR